MTTFPISVVTQTINAPYDAVAACLADPARSHEWATQFFAGPLVPVENGEWTAQVPMMGGEARYRLEADLDRGIIDIYLAPKGGDYGPPLPVRLLHNGDGIDVLWVLTRFPGTTDEQWEAGQEGMRHELIQLARLMEG